MPVHSAGMVFANGLAGGFSSNLFSPGVLVSGLPTLDPSRRKCCKALWPQPRRCTVVAFGHGMSSSFIARLRGAAARPQALGNTRLKKRQQELLGLNELDLETLRASAGAIAPTRSGER
jgi:hypothetical protein